MGEVICLECQEIHGRDTNMGVICPHCNKRIGCFWHLDDKMEAHLRECAALALDDPAKAVWP